ncbi:MAG: hypothetical protein ACRDYV_10510, partial [Acidimicrobiia bacterium]
MAGPPARTLGDVLDGAVDRYAGAGDPGGTANGSGHGDGLAGRDGGDHDDPDGQGRIDGDRIDGDGEGRDGLEGVHAVLDDAAARAAGLGGWTVHDPLRLSKHLVTWLLRCPRRAVAAAE